MKILEDQHNGPFSCEMFEEASDAPEDLPPHRLAIEILHTLLEFRRDRKPQQRGQVRQDVGDVVWKERTNLALELALAFGLTVLLRDAEPAAENLEKRPVAQGLSE